MSSPLSSGFGEVIPRNIGKCMAGRSTSEYLKTRYRNRQERSICQRCSRAVERSNFCEYHALIHSTDKLRGKGVSIVEVKKARQAAKNFNGQCACCNSKNPGHVGWCFDHDHETLKFRGIICWSCNATLGHAKDSVRRLLFAIVYLSMRLKIKVVQEDSK